MGYVVYGAGAIGGVVGGRLFQAGFDVTLIARGRHLDMLRDHGLRIESPAGSAILPIPAVSHPGDVDWSKDQTVLMAVKSQQASNVLSDLASVAPPTTPIVCLMNGVANEPAALRIFPHVHAVCVMCPAGHLEPGVVQAWSSPIAGLLDIGRYPRGSDEVSRRVSRDLEASTFSSLVVEDVLRWKYRKLLTNLGNAVEALCGLAGRGSPLGQLLVAEGEVVLAASRIDVATTAEDRNRRAQLLQLGEIAGRTRQGGSSWQSVERRTGDIETDYLNGEIVLLGRMADVPTPANQLVQNLARELALERRAPGTMTAASILEQLD